MHPFRLLCFESIITAAVDDEWEEKKREFVPAFLSFRFFVSFHPIAHFQPYSQRTQTWKIQHW